MEAKEAMQKGHINKAKKYAKNLKDSPDKIKLMQQLGMSDIPELTVINGSWNVSSDGPISPSVKEITGTFTVSNNSDFGNVEKVSTLDLTSNLPLTRQKNFYKEPLVVRKFLWVIIINLLLMS